jgi:hypothetical protein
VCSGRPVSMSLTRRRVVMFLWSVLRGDSMKFRIRSNPKPRPAPGLRGRARSALEILLSGTRPMACWPTSSNGRRRGL